MNLISLAILAVVLIVVAAVVWWLAVKTGVWAKLPEPLRYVVYGIVAIIAILIVANLAGLGPPLVNLR